MWPTKRRYSSIFDQGRRVGRWLVGNDEYCLESGEFVTVPWAAALVLFGRFVNCKCLSVLSIKLTCHLLSSRDKGKQRSQRSYKRRLSCIGVYCPLSSRITPKEGPQWLAACTWGAFLFVHILHCFIEDCQPWLPVEDFTTNAHTCFFVIILWKAAYRGDLEGVQFLFEHGATVHDRIGQPGEEGLNVLELMQHSPTVNEDHPVYQFLLAELEGSELWTLPYRSFS